MHKLTIGWMYPDLLNLHGEKGSIQALQRTAENLGLEAQVLRFDRLSDPIPFDTLDVIVFLPGELTALAHIKKALEPQQGALRAYVENGGHLIALGTSGMLFGQDTQRTDGSVFQGFGILDMNAKERRYVHGDDFHFRINDTKQEIAGAQIQMVDVSAAHPLGQTLYGRGNDGSGAEGARYKNLIYTNCTGPVFVKNPWWAETIIKDICLKKELGLSRKKTDTIASNGFDSLLRFIVRKPKK
jgi:CobQ-like glutamine amidotransferase family enzyme